MAGYRERRARLAGAVVWARTGVAEFELPVLPDGCMDLIWTEGRLVVAGPDTVAYRPDPGGGEFAGFRFAPGTAPAVLGVPAAEVRDRRVDLAELWPAARVRALFAGVDDAADRPAALEAAVLRRAAERPAPDPALGRVVAALDAGQPVRYVAERAGWTARTLHRRSLAAFGYGPKTLARVLRLQRGLARARAGVPLAETAVGAGYADQAHFTREVRELTGLTPAGLLRGGG
ncbi:helix-turn-helix transcriptional regulator [Nocardia asteroides]|uniref:helix-turn-helix transcriptional regulator n=1 Tax=Nocardia asteroides TaxID=1824 RepID=UPI001E647598|nr:helix-turn-helix domain-containing protein [Nocardia asteroides]UGT63970.1 helix-turn-helix domain-containing protein [Nocardia asteroides]